MKPPARSLHSPPSRATTTSAFFLDYHLGDGNGLAVLRGIRGAGIEVPVVMLTGQGDGRSPSNS